MKLLSLFACLALGMFGASGALAQALDETPRCPSPPANDAVAFRGPIPITVSTGLGRYVFSTEVAYENAERARGMMFRESLEPDQGMLFVANADSVESFYMRNTCVSLDLVWVSADFRVVGVTADAVPFDESPILAPEPVRYVFEIPGGRAAEIGLQAGDVLMFGEAG